MEKRLFKAAKEMISLMITLILLFNISGDIFAYSFEIQDEISKELKETLEEIRIDKENNNYELCVREKKDESCKSYLKGVRQIFTESAKGLQEEKRTYEEQESYSSYEARAKKAIGEAYKKAEEEIEQAKKEAILFGKLSWSEINRIEYKAKKDLEAAKAWAQAEEGKIKGNYKIYEAEYKKWVKEIEKDQEALGNKYLKAEGKRLIEAYKASNNKGVKEDARELLVLMTESERKEGEIIEDRKSLEQIFLEGLKGDVCAYNVGSRTLTKAGADKYIGYDKPGVYPSLTREDWEIIPASYKDPRACESAFRSLEGLSHLRSSKEGINEIKRFMAKNSHGLAAYDSLLNGSAVLLKWKAYSSLKSYMENSFKKEKSNDNKGIGGFGGVSETIAYNGRYLGEESVYTQREDGSNAWEDLAGLLSEEGSAQSQELLKMSLSGCKIVKEIIGRDKLECDTILPFLYGALIYAPKVMDKAEPYQEAIPLEKEYMDKNGKLHVIDKEYIKRKNALIKKEFNEKIREYGSSVSSGLAGFLYNIKFNDMPVDSKMALDNRLAKVYRNIKGYSKGSARYKKLESGRAVVSIFKYLGIAIDVWCFVSLVGIGVKGVGGARALIKAKNLMKGVNSLTIGQRANLLRKIAFIREGAQLRHFGRKTADVIIKSGDIGRKINAGVYLAEKNGMGNINYMLHNLAYGRGKNIVLKNNILRVEGLESGEFYKSSHYIAGLHKDIFRINRDIRRGVKVGISELGEGGTVLSYIDKAKLGIFKEYTQDFIKGQKVVKGSKGGKIGQGLMKGETSLLPREVLYSRKYKKILPFVQDLGFTRDFKLGEKVYEGLRGEGFFVTNIKTGEIFNDYVFNFEGYLSKNNLLGGLITPSKKLAKSSVSNFNTGTLINNEASFANEFNLAKNIDFLKVQKPLTISNKADGILALTKTFIPAINKEKIFGGLAAGNIFNFNISIEGLNIKLPKLSRSAGNIALQKFPGREITGLSAKNNILLGTNFSSEIIYKPGDPLSPVMYDGVETPKKEAIASVANELISKMLIYGVSHKLNQQQGIIYNNILQELYQVLAPSLEDPAVKLKNVLEKADWFMTETAPLVFLQGEDTIVLEPNHIDETDLFVYNISGQKDYKAFIAEKIKGLSSVQKEYTVYIQMHGQKDKSLKVDGKRTTTLDEILDIIEANKEDATVNVILGACFSGSALSLNLLRDKINVLLLSGANDVCTVYDSEFIRINDLRSSYIEAIKNGYYGAYLFYEGKIFNTLVDTKASLPKENPLNAELNILRKIYFSKEPLGLNLFKLLSMSPKYQAPQYPFTKLIKFSVPPQIFNMEANLNFFDNYIHHNKKSWEYVVEHYDDKWMFIDKKEIFFNEPKEETTSLLYNAAQEELKKAFPNWNYNPITENKFSDIPVMPDIDDGFLLSGNSKISLPSGNKTSLPDVLKTTKKPHTLFIRKTPDNIANLFIAQGLKPEQAQNLASICFEGNKQKYNPQIFEKVQELLQKKVEPKYIETMIMALSEKGKFSLDLYKKAVALHEKYDISLPVSAYMVSLGEYSVEYDKTVYDNIEKLLKNNFDFSKINRAYISLLFHKENNQIVKELDTAIVDILANFSKGPKEFDVEAWSNFIYLANRKRNSYLSFNYAVGHCLAMKDIFKPAWEVLGIKTVADALDLNPTRYTKVFRDFTKVIEPELFPLLKEQLSSLSEEEKLRVVSLLAASVNRVEKVLNVEDKKALIKKISYKPAFKEAINHLVFDQLGWEYTDRLGKIFDFSSNTYLNHILEGSYKFRKDLSLLYEAIKPNAGKPIKQIFDELPENKAFAEICAKNGINYQAWRSYDPNDFITRKVLINGAKKPLTTEEITVRKVDMDNIAKALTTGNESSSCRSVGKGSCGEASPNLIKNKMVQQVEILAKGRPVGNALIYLAEVDGQTSIIVGSFVKKVPYYSYEVTKLLLDYIRKIRQDITYKEIPIYYSSYLNINNYYKYPLKEHEVMLLGEGHDAIFNSFTHEFVLPFSHKTDKVALYTIEEGRPDPKITPDMIRQKLHDIDSDFVETIIENLSPKGKLVPELYEKASELAQKYDDSMLKTSDLVGYCMQNGSFNEAIYEKIKLMYENKVKFNKLTMLRKCEVNGVFREDLFNKGMSLNEDFGSLVPQIITEFIDVKGNFKEEYFKGFVEIAKNTEKLFFNIKSALKETLYEADVFKKAFDLLGVEEVVKSISSNRDRYLSVFRDLFIVVNDKNAALLKEKLAPLPLEKKMEILTLIAGGVDKKDEILGEQAIQALINKIPNEKAFKEEINRIVFKRFSFKYTPELAKIFDFSSNKYIALIMLGNDEFNAGFTSLFKAFKTNIKKPVKQIFDELPENKAFAEICAENGINYQAWRGYDPNSFITRKVLVNADYSDPKYLQKMALLYPKYDIKDILAKKIVDMGVREVFTVRKVDMDNVSKALTSGNESGSCRSVGTGACREASPNLIRNKMVQQVELVDSDNKVVGNVLIYLAEVNGELAIVMGSIVRRSTYYVSTEINDLVIDYVRQMRKDIGRPDIPIYMSTYLKAPNYFPIEWRMVDLLGEGDNAIFNSFTHSFEVPSEHKTNTVLLYEVDEGETYLNWDNQFSFAPVSLLQVKSNLIGANQKEFFGIPVFKLDVFNGINHSVGTGFYLKYRNFPFILTAAHNIKDAKGALVYTDNGFSMYSKVLNISKESDLAVLSVPEGKLDYTEPWRLALKEPEVGEDVFSIGFPNGKERQVNNITLLKKQEPVKDSFFYLHDKGTITHGASGSPLSKGSYFGELVGVITVIDKNNPVAASVPLPQIKTFLGETIKKILFTPELNKKYTQRYPAFAKNYENVLNKYNLSDEVSLPKKPLFTGNKIAPQIFDKGFKPTSL